jgi:disulfide bond formation protein DsbB
MDTPTLFTASLALFTLIGNMLTVVYGLLWVIVPRTASHISDVLARWMHPIVFFLASSSTIGSLIYSEVVGFPACILCWIQRIFMYPLMFMFGFSWLRRDNGVVRYGLLLSLLGGAVALYQWIKDMLALYSDVKIPCPAVTDLPSCDRIYVLEYGYITIPMIALNAFVLIAIVLYAKRRTLRNAI